MPTGKVKWFNSEKGFGFLSRDDGGDVFVHSSVLPDGVDALKPGQRVEFGVVAGQRGDQALSVTLLDPTPSVAAAQRRKPDELAVHRPGPHDAAGERHAGRWSAAATPTRRTATRSPACCARSPTSSTSEPAPAWPPDRRAPGRPAGSLDGKSQRVRGRGAAPAPRPPRG